VKDIPEPDQILKNLLVPDNTRIEANRIMVDGDVIVGNHSSIRYGILGDMVILGEGVNVYGDILAGSDVRVDMWSKLGGSVEVGKNVYLGEFVNIDGKLVIEGDLDVGKEVKIRGGFEVKGWIMVRNPVPVIIFIFLYIREMMHLGKDEEIEKAIEELFEDSEDFQGIEGKELSEKILIIPAGAKISPEEIEVTGEVVIGSNCLLIGDIRAHAVETGKNLTLKGSICSEANISIGESNTVYGNLSSKGQVNIGQNSRVFGGIKAESVLLHGNTIVDGTIKAPLGVSFLREAAKRPQVLAEINVLGKEIKNDLIAQSRVQSQSEFLKTLKLIEISPITIKSKSARGKKTFVPDRKETSAKIKVLGRTRRIGGVRRIRRKHEDKKP
jgi:predicted acyltransferase (DUF342 family)